MILNTMKDKIENSEVNKHIKNMRRRMKMNLMRVEKGRV